jgi:serine phosphatase RsbU (regulator of sigma subunit)
MVAEELGLGSPAFAGQAGRLQALLVEDDDGDALLVEDLLVDAGAAVDLHRVRSLAEAKPLLAQTGCVLLDLGLPDSQGLHGVRLLREQEPGIPVVVLTGQADEHLGAAAVRAGAQDYLVKGQVNGQMLGRVVRYAVERLRAEEAQRQLSEARIHAQENARLERGLLPSPLLTDERLTVSSRYRPGGRQLLLGGDFYDVVQATGGWVHAMVGDVSGRGPAEAALGVCLRVAWRTMVLASRPVPEILSTVQQVLVHERQDERMFATLCMLSVAPDLSSGQLWLAGHPRPVLIGQGGVGELSAPVCMPLGITDSSEWPGSTVTLGEDWSVLVYTDGLIEGRIGEGPERLGSEGLIDMLNAGLSGVSAGYGTAVNGAFLDRVIDQVRERNGGELDDDLAALALGRLAGQSLTGRS